MNPIREYEVKDDAGGISALTKAFDDFIKADKEYKSANDARITELKAGKADPLTAEKLSRIDAALEEIKAAAKKAADEAKAEKAALEAEVLALKRGNRTGNVPSAYSTKASEALDGFMRKGLNQSHDQSFDLPHETKTMLSQSQPDGGYMIVPELDRAIDEVLKITSPFRDVARVVQVGTATYKKLINARGTNSGWVGETDSRTATNTSTFLELELPVMEVYANPQASQASLDDAFMNLEQFIADEVSVEFAYQEGNAFIMGNGTRKPRGIVGGYTPAANASYAWGNPGYIASGASGAFAASNPADPIIDLYHALRIPYRNNAVWLMNNSVLGSARKLKDGQSNYLINRIFSTDGIVEQMLGKTVAEMNDMPDLAANSYSIAFGDFKRAYTVVDRVGIRILRDPYTNKPHVGFYTTKRVGGGVTHFEAYKLMKFATS